MILATFSIDICGFGYVSTVIAATARRAPQKEVVSDPARKLKSNALPYPDVHWWSPTQARRKPTDWRGGVEMVRCGPGVDAFSFLKEIWGMPENFPDYLALQGPVTATQQRAFQKLGYRKSMTLTRNQWAAGGPAGSALDYADTPKPQKVNAEHDVYLWRPGE